MANYNNVPNDNRLVLRAEADARGWKPINELQDAQGPAGTAEGAVEGAADVQAGAPYAIQVNAGWCNTATGVPCGAPPYGGFRQSI